VSGHLEPGPFEPTWVPFQSRFSRLWIPLVHRSRIEHESAADVLGVRTVCVTEDDRVGRSEAAAQRTRQAGVRTVSAQAQGPEQGLRLLDPPAPVAMDDHDAPALNPHLPAGRKIAKGNVVVPPHSLDRSDGSQRSESFRTGHIARVNHEVDPSKHLEQPLWEAVEELWAVRIRDHTDARRQGFSLVRNWDFLFFA